MENLMSALGQESEKVESLKELLQERGFDPTSILDEVRLTPREFRCASKEQAPGCCGVLEFVREHDTVEKEQEH